jgi:hypothetical protein
MRVIRAVSILLMVVLAVAGAGTASAKKKRHAEANGRRADKRARRLLDKATGPVTLTLESVDLAAAQAVVTVTGIRFEPDGRLFAFHDDKDRHFIALEAKCQAVDKAVRCTLDLPRPYLSKSNVLGMTINVHERDVEAAAAEVQAKFVAARASVEPAPPATATASDGGAAGGAALDGGVAPGDAGAEARAHWWGSEAQ